MIRKSIISMMGQEKMVEVEGLSPIVVTSKKERDLTGYTISGAEASVICQYADSNFNDSTFPNNPHMKVIGGTNNNGIVYFANTTTAWSAGTRIDKVDVYGTVFEPIVGHSYLHVIKVKSASTSYLYLCTCGKAKVLNISSSWSVESDIHTHESNTATYVQISKETNPWYLAYEMVFDLTQMFGSGNEPTTADAFAHRLGYDSIDNVPYIPYTDGIVVGCGDKTCNLFNVYAISKQTINGVTIEEKNGYIHIYGKPTTTSGYTTFRIDGAFIVDNIYRNFVVSRQGFPIGIGITPSGMLDINGNPTGELNFAMAEISTEKNASNVKIGQSAALLNVRYDVGEIDLLLSYQLEEGSYATSYEPYGYKLPISVKDSANVTTTKNIYIKYPLMKIGSACDVLQKSAGGVKREIGIGDDGQPYVLPIPTFESITIPTLSLGKGSNTISVDTTYKPSNMSVKARGIKEVE